MKFVDKIYIISMHRHGIRRKNVYDDLLSAGYPHKKIEWVDAIDGSKLDIDELLDENKKRKNIEKKYLITLRKFRPTTINCNYLACNPRTIFCK